MALNRVDINFIIIYCTKHNKCTKTENIPAWQVSTLFWCTACSNMLVVFQSGRRSWCCSLSGHLHTPHPHCFPAASSFPFPLSITRSCHAASHALHLHLSLSGSLSPLPRLPGVNSYPASFSRQPSPYCWATSHSADPERTQRPRTPPIPSPPPPQPCVLYLFVLARLLAAFSRVALLFSLPLYLLSLLSWLLHIFPS